MTAVALIESSGFADTDDVLRLVIGDYLAAFPGRIASVYLAGSYGNRTAIPTSDVDFILVFEDSLSMAEVEKAVGLTIAHGLRSGHDLDVKPHSRSQLWRLGFPVLKHGHRCIFGRDLKTDQPPTGKAIRHLNMYFPIEYLHRIRGDVPILSVPLEYPNADDTFRGYPKPKPVAGRGGRSPVKSVVHSVIKPTSALIMARSGIQLQDKRQSAELFGRYVDAAWAEFIDEVLAWCRDRWDYEFPETVEERARLASICDRVLAFENYYLEQLGEFLLEEIEDSSMGPWLSILETSVAAGLSEAELTAWADSGRLESDIQQGERVIRIDQFYRLVAISFMGQLIYHEPRHLAALQSFAADGSELVKRLASHALAARNGSG